MAAKKFHKCMYTHCKHTNKDISNEDEVQVGCRYYHTDCAKEINNIKQIRECYINNISDTVVVAFLNKVINTIIFNKNVSSDYLLFCVRYAAEHHLKINSPAGLHYLIDNSKIKEAYQKKQTEIIKSEIKVSCDDDFDFSINTVKPVATKRKSFADILRGESSE